MQKLWQINKKSIHKQKKSNINEGLDKQLEEKKK